MSLYKHLVVVETNTHVAYFVHDKSIRYNTNRSIGQSGINGIWHGNTDLCDEMSMCSIYDFEPRVCWEELCKQTIL